MMDLIMMLVAVAAALVLPYLMIRAGQKYYNWRMKND